jgi:methylmalonyl-CoA/ethylmalonyl-CoA epimerase
MALRKSSLLLLSSLPTPTPARASSFTRTIAASARAFSTADSDGDPARARRLNHVAVAVPDLARAAERWRELAGASSVSWPPQAVPSHGVSVVFVQLGNVKIELLAPLGENSPIAKFLERNKRGGVHHLCLEVESAAAALEAARGRGQRVLTETPSPGAHGTPVGFLHPADFDGCLLEVEEVGPEDN